MCINLYWKQGCPNQGLLGKRVRGKNREQHVLWELCSWIFLESRWLLKGFQATTSISLMWGADCFPIMQSCLCLLRGEGSCWWLCWISCCLRSFKVSSNVTVLLGHKKLYFIVYQKFHSMLWGKRNFCWPFSWLQRLISILSALSHSSAC